MDIAAQNCFYRVFSSYRQGIVRKDRPIEAGLAPSAWHRLDFDQLSFCACLGLSAPQERLASQENGWAARRGFLAARAGELDLARKHFAESWERWRELREGFCRTRLVGIIEGYEAYLDYRLSSRSEARRRLERALDAALLLEERYGLTLFELQRIQLGHNLARIDWRLGSLEESLLLAGALVGYLQGQRRDLPFHRDWRVARMQSCPVYLRKAMIVQIAGEAINQLVVHCDRGYWETFLSEANIGEEGSGQFFVDSRLWRWLLACRARLQGDGRRYLEILEEILPPGPRGLGTSYYSMLVDFADFCSADQSIAARKVIGFFSRDAPKWKGFPAVLAQRLSEICDGNSTPSPGIDMGSGSEARVVA